MAETVASELTGAAGPLRVSEAQSECMWSCVNVGRRECEHRSTSTPINGKLCPLAGPENSEASAADSKQGASFWLILRN